MSSRAFVKKDFRDIAETVLAQLSVGQIDEKHTFTSDKIRYKLSHGPVRNVVSVEGETGGIGFAFQKDVDFFQNGDMIEWSGKTRPDVSSVFTVRYLFGDPSPTRRLTDTNVGSVTRTLVESIAREMEFFYEQLDAVYSSAFIDSATGNSLDLVVAVLGVTRKPPQFASGRVTFGRGTDPPEVPVDPEVRLYDGSPEFKLKVNLVKSVKKLEGVVNGKKYVFAPGKDFKLDEGRILWLDGSKPDLDSQFRIEYSAYEQISVPNGMLVSTFSNDSTKIRTYRTTQEGSLQKVEGGWEVEVSIRAERAGLFGNTAPGSITTMPQPPVGIEFVINRRGIAGGVEAESDGNLRTRAKRTLQSIGKATLPSLEGALRAVEGVRSAIIEEMPGGAVGIVRAVVQGGELAQIEKVVQDTRAAGIKVELSRPEMLYADVSITASLDEETAQGKIREQVEGAIRNYLSLLEVGQDIVYNQLITQVMEVPGVHDVVGMEISIIDIEQKNVRTSSGTNIRVEANQLIEPRTVTVVLEPRQA